MLCGALLACGAHAGVLFSLALSRELLSDMLPAPFA